MIMSRSSCAARVGVSGCFVRCCSGFGWGCWLMRATQVWSVVVLFWLVAAVSWVMWVSQLCGQPCWVSMFCYCGCGSVVLGGLGVGWVEACGVLSAGVVVVGFLAGVVGGAGGVGGVVCCSFYGFWAGVGPVGPECPAFPV